MADQNIFFKIKSMFSGEGFKQLQKDAKDTNSAASVVHNSINSIFSVAKKMGGALGEALQGAAQKFSTVSSVAKDFVKAISTGNVWGIAAAAISGLVRLGAEFGGVILDWIRGTKDHEKSIEKLINTYDNFLAKAKTATNNIANSHNQINAAIDSALKKRKDEIAAISEMAQAEAELARQRDIANGGDGKSAALAAKEAELKTTRDLLAAEKEAANLRRSEAQKTLDESREQLAQLVEKRDMLQELLDSEKENTAEAARRGGILSGLADIFRSQASEAIAAKERAKEAVDALTDSDKFKTMNGQVDQLNKLIEQTASTVDKATKTIEAEGAELERIANKEIVLSAKVETERLRNANEVAQEETRLREEQLAEEERLRKETNKRIADELKEAAKEREQIERDTLEKKKEMLEEAYKAELKNMDNLLAEAKGKMGEWEKEAQKARGKGFDDWLKEEQKRKNQQGRQDRKMEAEMKRVDKQIEQLEERERKGMLSKQEQERLDALRKWRAAQDPKNNPFLDEIKNLALRRDGLIRATKDEISEIKKQLNNLGLK